MQQKSTHLPKYPTLSTLNEKVIDDSNPSNGQADRHWKPNPDKESIASFGTVHSNLTPVDIQKHCPLYSLEQADYIGPKDSAFLISKTPTLLSYILKPFDKELHNKTAEF